MKRRLPTIAVLAASILLFATACAGAPKPAAPVTEPTPPAEPAPIAEPEPAPVVEPTPPPPPEEVKPDEAAIAALAAAKDRAEKSRKQAFDIEAPSYFPDGWKSAEADFLRGRERAQEPTPAAYEEATAAYTSAADAYDEIARKSLPLYAEARSKEIQKARADAIAAGAADVDPDRLAAADALVDKAASQYESEDYYGAAESARGAFARYVALKTGVDAYAVKSEIDRRDFAAYDPGNYSLAEGKLEVALSSYDSGNLSVCQDSAEEALLRYKLALRKGMEMNASGRGRSAADARNAALALKANVAVKADFASASSVYTDAEKAFKAEKYDEAADLYVQSERLFADARMAAAEKRKAAEAAIADAEQRMSESEQKAKEADAVIEGGQ